MSLKNLMLTPPVAALAFAVTTFAAPASASSPDQAKSEEVRYADLNLASEEGVKTLDHRLKYAVKRVCGFDGGLDGFQTKSCYHDTWNVSVRPQRDKVIDAARRNPSVQIAASGLTIVRP